MKRQTLMLLTIRGEIEKMYMQELTTVFDGYLEVTSRSREQNDEADVIRALKTCDILLLTNTDLFEWVRPHVGEGCILISLQYGFSKDRMEYLKSLPDNTSALVCFNFYMIATQTITMLYENGLRNLNLEAYRPGQQVRPGQYDVTIIGDMSTLIPENAARLVSLGARRVSPVTLFSIASAADVQDEALERRILSFSKDLFTMNKMVSRFYDLFAANKLQLKTIMNCIDYAIMVCGEDYRILDFNDNVKSYLDVQGNINRMYLGAVPRLVELGGRLTGEEPVRNLLVEIRGRNVLVTREDLDSVFEAGTYHIFLMKDVTKLLMLEDSARKQMLRRGHVAKYTLEDICGASPAMVRSIDRAQKIAAIDKTTLVVGESGVGKELFVQSIHNLSSRREFPFLALNCAALPDELLESELFGYTEGSFTGAKKGGKPGLFELANHGTFFLDEVGEISLGTQAKLLRVLEEKEIMRIGSGEIIPVDVRVIAATNRNLRTLVEQGKFRSDLYYRLCAVELSIPPLRERREDIPLLARSFLDHAGLERVQIAPEAMDFFLSFPWAGNVRELRNCVEYMGQVCDGVMELSHLPAYILEETGAPPPAAAPAACGETPLSRAVLECLGRKELSRPALLEALGEQGLSVSDYRLRRELAALCAAGRIEIGKGRRPMRLR